MEAARRRAAVEVRMLTAGRPNIRLSLFALRVILLMITDCAATRHVKQS